MAEKPHRWMQAALSKHPGKLTREASAAGRSKLEQAEHDSHSSNPHTRSRGILGKRLILGHGKP
jgi:hypothetical protein